MKQIIEGLETEITTNTSTVQTLKDLLNNVASDLSEAQKKLEALTTAHAVLTGKDHRPVLVKLDSELPHRSEAARSVQSVERLGSPPTPPPVDQGPPCPSCGATKLFRTNRKLSNGRTVSMTACGECSTELLG